MDDAVSALNAKLQFIEKIRYESKPGSVLGDRHIHVGSTSSELHLAVKSEKTNARLLSAKQRVESLGIKELLAKPLPCESLNLAKVDSRYSPRVSQSHNEVLAPRKLDLLPSAHPQSPVRVLPSPKKSDSSSPFRFTSTLLSLEDAHTHKSPSKRIATEEKKKDLFQTSAELESLNLGLKPQEALELAKKMMEEQGMDKIMEASGVDVHTFPAMVSESLATYDGDTYKESSEAFEARKDLKEAGDEKMQTSNEQETELESIYSSAPLAAPFIDENGLSQDSEEEVASSLITPEKKAENVGASNLAPPKASPMDETNAMNVMQPVAMNTHEPQQGENQIAPEEPQKEIRIEKDFPEQSQKDDDLECCKKCHSARIRKVELNVGPLSVISSSSHPITPKTGHTSDRRFESFFHDDADEEYFEDQRIEAFISALKRDCLEDYMKHISKARSLNPSVTIPRFEFDISQQNNSAEDGHNDSGLYLSNKAPLIDNAALIVPIKKESPTQVNYGRVSSQDSSTSHTNLHSDNKQAFGEEDIKQDRVQSGSLFTLTSQKAKSEFGVKSSPKRYEHGSEEVSKSSGGTPHQSPTTNAIQRPYFVRKTHTQSALENNTTHDPPKIASVSTRSQSITPPMFKPVSDPFLQSPTELTVESTSNVAIVPVPVRVSSRGSVNQQFMSPSKRTTPISSYSKLGTPDGKSTPLVVVTQKEIEKNSSLSEDSSDKASIVSAESIVFVDTPKSFVTEDSQLTAKANGDVTPVHPNSNSKLDLEARIAAIKELLALETEKMKSENVKSLDKEKKKDPEGKSENDSSMLGDVTVQNCGTESDETKVQAHKDPGVQKEEHSSNVVESVESASQASKTNYSPVPANGTFSAMIERDVQKEEKKNIEEEQVPAKKNGKQGGKAKILSKKSVEMPLFKRRKKFKKSLSHLGKVLPSQFPLQDRYPDRYHGGLSIQLHPSTMIPNQYLYPLQIPLIALPAGSDFLNSVVQRIPERIQTIPSSDTMKTIFASDGKKKEEDKKTEREKNNAVQSFKQDSSLIVSQTAPLDANKQVSISQKEPTGLATFNGHTKPSNSTLDAFVQISSVQPDAHYTKRPASFNNEPKALECTALSEENHEQAERTTEVKNNHTFEAHSEVLDEDEDELDQVISVCGSLFQTMTDSKHLRAEMESTLRSMLDAIGETDFD